MAFEFKLPEIGEGVKEGEIVKWLVKKGEKVREEQPLLEVMTDKATIEIPSPCAGKIALIHAKEGETVKVGKALLTFEGNEGTSVVKEAAPPPPPKPAAPVEKRGAVLASPATRKLARELGVDLTQVRGTGPGGRITSADLGKRTTATPGKEERIPFRGIRRKTAEHMRASLDTAAHFTLVEEVDMTEVAELRESLKSQAEARGVKLTYLPFVVRAVSLALREYPRLNSSLDEEKGEIVVKGDHHVGIAVNNRENDLVVPVVRNAERRSILALAAEISSLAEKARNNALTPADLSGGTFSITSVGNIGGLFATPIINTPEAAILGFYRIEERPAVRNGQIVIRKIGHLSLSVDHRIVDGAMAAAFLAAVQGNLEDPKRLFNLLDA